MNVREEIRLHACDEDKPVLDWLFDRYHWASKWSFVAKCTFQRYGIESYAVHRIWAPTTEGRALYAHMKDHVTENVTQEP
jgi:hypothetical protein